MLRRLVDARNAKGLVSWDAADGVLQRATVCSKGTSSGERLAKRESAPGLGNMSCRFLHRREAAANVDKNGEQLSGSGSHIFEYTIDISRGTVPDLSNQVATKLTRAAWSFEAAGMTM
jgi:hypothetical protein